MDLLADLDLVERGLGDVDVSPLDQFRHLAIEERQEQRPDVRAVDVGIGHHDDAVIAQLVRVVLFLAETASQRGDKRGDLRGGEELV